MNVCIWTNVLINEWACTLDLFDSYGFKADMTHWFHLICIVWPTVELKDACTGSYCGQGDMTIFQGGGKCWVSVSHRGLATRLLTPFPCQSYLPHQACLLCHGLYTSHHFPPPLISRCHHDPVWSQTVWMPFHCCKCHLSYTLMLPTETPLFSTLLIFHVFSFILCVREPFSSSSTQPCPYILLLDARILFPAVLYFFLLIILLLSVYK